MSEPNPAEPTPREIRPGDLIGGRYRIEYRVGEGGGGEVYKAQDEKLDRTVALKRMLGGGPEERLRSASDEARIVARLEHPSIPTVHDLIVDEGELFMITSFVDGYSIYRILREGDRWALSRSIEACRQLASVLKFAHGRRVAHSDIKPSNILVSDDGSIVLTDFGVARVLGQERVRPGPRILKGTQGYLAPEIYDADVQRLDLRTCARWDLYALGVVFFNLLVHEMPNELKTEALTREIRDGLRKSLAAELDKKSDEIGKVPDPLYDAIVDLLARSMEPNPDQRIQSADEFIEGLDTIAELLAAPAAKPRPLKTALLAAVALGAGLLVGVLLPL